MQPTTRLPSLLAQAEQRAHDDYTRRLAELKQLSPLLGHLDELLPELEAQGLKIWSTECLRLTTHWPAGSLVGRRQKVLRLDTRGWVDGDATARKWHQALLALGFTEIRRGGGEHYPDVTLRRGHLWLEVDLPRQPVVPAVARVVGDEVAAC